MSKSSMYTGSGMAPAAGLAFEASTDPVDTLAQAALAPPQTTEQKESADTTFMAM
jgi:hypothetical protein